MKRTCFLVMAMLLVLPSGCGGETVQVKQTKPQASPYTLAAPQAGGTGKWYRGREIAARIGAGGGAWLERDTRQEEDNVSQAIAAMPLDSNSVVADIGAGVGYFTFRLASRVPRGRVYAVEVQERFLAALRDRRKAQGLHQVTVVKGGEQSPNLPSGAIDLALMVDVYHELAYPQEMLQAIRKALRPGGQLLLLEYRAEDPTLPIHVLHKMSVAQINKELQANGFKLKSRQDFLPRQHFLLYDKTTP